MPTILEVYEKLKPKLGEEEARVLIEFVEASVEQKAATKEDLQKTELALRGDLQKTELTLREELRQVDQALREELRQVDQALREELRRVEQALREEIHKLDQKIEVTKSDLIKWSFGFWIGNVAVMSGIMFAIIRFASK
ncbi:MAG: DUF1640 domain-containing protein [Candidatus Tectomicrobia bacterium]|nr:DUF1640 domain-containing protein [Candidatus Tectomicrobia bacterium]